ncbi:lipoyl synthase [Ichthyobacterium seriolicida]|uniref:Lipoyl synthase n=1 Tax=Ichthyobacterium seriolicida TaxID=242600 RepID=A0A1J1DZ75_9FLAO|nr:lipoyl synthase [Ichthyobacterium seriolicida]BAV95193.1 lipoate synthase [Ichthyobacterium seriolicida]
MELMSPPVKKEKPKWLKVKLPIGKKYTNLRKVVDNYKLHTICESGKCPNMGECWGQGTATFMILGNICTRSCGFCAVYTGRPLPVDWNEPDKVAQSIQRMNIKHAVLTSVDRDELEDGGSIIWAETVKAVRRINPNTTLETLIPDFAGKTKNIDRLIKVAPEIISHNMETVKRLTRAVRIQAKYERSLEVLKYIKENKQKRTKTGIMLGLGEKKSEVIDTLIDLKDHKVDIVTIGQYLQPTPKHLPVIEFIKPEVFQEYKKIGIEMGFKYVESGPLVRSSYMGKNHLV